MSIVANLTYSLVVCLTSNCDTYTERVEGSLSQCLARKAKLYEWPPFNAPKVYCTQPITAKRKAPVEIIEIDLTGDKEQTDTTEK